jgi:hypothetical protein
VPDTTAAEAGATDDTGAGRAETSDLAARTVDEGRIGLFDGVKSDPADVLAERQGGSIWGEESDRLEASVLADADPDDAYMAELRKARLGDGDVDLDAAEREDAGSPPRFRSRFGRKR